MEALNQAAELMARHAALLERVTVLERALEKIILEAANAGEAAEIAHEALNGSGGS